MTEKPVQPPLEEKVTDPETGIEHSNWEFIKDPPTEAQVKALLATIPDVHGIRLLDYYEFVQALPANKKIKVQHPTNPRVKVDEYIDNWVLYVSVAGRQAMLNAAQAKNDWRVDYDPEPNSPVGAPGFLSMEQRIVYREYIRIWQYLPDEDEPKLLGVRPGQAWVPFSGGSQAAGSNPYEKVETAARGRALGAWGFGVIPGSGIASLEEMQGVQANLSGIQQEQAQHGTTGPDVGRSTRKPREDMIEELYAEIETLRQATNDTEAGMVAKVGFYLSKTLGARGVYDEVDGIIHWDQVKDGHLVLLTNFIRQKNVDIKAKLV